MTDYTGRKKTGRCAGPCVGGPYKDQYHVNPRKRFEVFQTFGDVIVEGEYRYNGREWEWYGPDIVPFPERV